MAGDAWFPLYTGDYLRDTMHLTTEEHGAYLLLLMSCWSAGGELDADEESLAAITRLPVERWRAMSRKLLRFFRAEGGVMTHDRVTLEIERAKEKSKKGAKGAAKRWGNAQDMPDDMPSGCPDDAQDIAPPPQPPPQPHSHSYTTTTNPDPVVVEIQQALIRCGVTAANAAELAIAAAGPNNTLAALQWLESQRVAGVLPYAPPVIYGRLTQAVRATLAVDQGWDDRQSDAYQRAVEKAKKREKHLRATVDAIRLPELLTRHGPRVDALSLADERQRLSRENQIWTVATNDEVRVELMRRMEMEVRRGNLANA